ncbi:MAG: AMP-dependent synthetase/ligase [Candidatus Omnitrophota bacterium]
MNGRYRNSPIPLDDPIGTIGTMILERAIEWSDDPIFAYRDSDDNDYKPVTWKRMLHDVVSLADFFRHQGIKKGDHVAVLSANNYAMLVWELAVTSMGAISVPIFAGYYTPQIDYILNHAEPDAILVEGAERLTRFQACSSASRIQTVVTHHINDPIDEHIDDPAGGFRFEACLSGGSTERFVKALQDVKLEDSCFIHYTSGTTGDPKGVMLSHRNIMSQRKAHGKVWEIARGSRFLSYLPWHHSYGGLFERFSALHHGAAIYLEDSLGKDIHRLIANWSKARPTHFFSVPKIYRALVTEAKLNAEIREILFHPELKFVYTAAAPLPRECGDYFDAHNVPILEGWGLTETSPTVTMTRPGSKRIHSYVGDPIPGCEILISEENEILVKGPNIMKGYYKDPERTARSIDHYGWLHTGDMGELSNCGLKLMYRRDGIFKLANGEKVSSTIVENELTAAPRWMNHAVVFGSAEDFVAALIFPHFRNLEHWALQNHKPLPSGWALSGDSTIQDMVRKEIEAANMELTPHYLRVKAFVILPDELSVENGCLTPTMKVIRHNINRLYKEWIHAIFRPDLHPDKLPYIVTVDIGGKQ